MTTHAATEQSGGSANTRIRKPKISKMLKKSLHHIEEARKMIETIKNFHSPEIASFSDICDVYLMLGELFCDVSTIRESVRASGGTFPNKRIIQKPPLLRRDEQSEANRL